jgi:hypothetical protein
MSESLCSAGRRTHLKIVAVGLLAAIIFVTVGIYSRIITSGVSVATVKAGKPAAYTESTSSGTR